MESEKLRELRAVHEVLDRLSPALTRLPRTPVVAETRRVLDQMRADIRAGLAHGMPAETRVEQALHTVEWPSLGRVINATGAVLHTNLAAPLGKRDAHTAALLERLLDAPAIAVE